MTDQISRIARGLIDASSFREELAQFATWLLADAMRRSSSSSKDAQRRLSAACRQQRGVSLRLQGRAHPTTP
jgi:hypothetical protein